jgi:RNA polymerase sigma-70 factor (ECF subfamily)
VESAIQDDRQRLLEAARGGDPEAADALLAGLRPLVSGYIRPRTRRAEDAEDLIQNVFLRASRNLTAFRGDCPFSQWIIRIAANELKNYYERTLPGLSRNLSLDFDWENSLGPQQPETDPGPYTATEDRSLIQQLVEVARSVCGKDEFAVLMMFYQGESLEEIGGLLQMKGATVRSHFLRARGKLLAHLLLHEPSLLGGSEAVRAAIETARREGLIDERESKSFARFDPRSELCRAACIKVARYLPIPVVLLTQVVPWTS